MNLNVQIIPACAILPTKNRAPILQRTLLSLLDQDMLPQRIVIVDASTDQSSENVIRAISWPSTMTVRYEKAEIAGAAHQRTQALRGVTEEFVCFLDDDIILEDQCIRKVFEGFSKFDKVGGVNAMITNQKYTPPGRFSRLMYRILDRQRSTWAGLVIGPAWNLLPEDEPNLPEWVPVEWMNLGCTFYRREALPTPVFPEFFKDYSLFEDLTLSLRVGRDWKLLNARTGRIFHDSQPADYKRNPVKMAAMEVVNRYFVMTAVLNRRGIGANFRFWLFQIFGVVSSTVQTRSFSFFIANIRGKIQGLKTIVRERIGRNRI